MISNNEFKLKIGRVVAILASTLAFSPAANAINVTIGNSSATSSGVNSNLGQSFINEPLGAGSSINLDTWTFSFFDVASRDTALGSVLTIFTGVGNGGITVGTSNTVATSSFGGGNAVTWTFNGGLSIIDNVTYSAVLAPTLAIKTNQGGDPYPDGAFTFNNGSFSADDTVFQATFSVPFEFDPSFGMLLLGGAWAGNRALKKFKASRNLDVTQQEKD